MAEHFGQWLKARREERGLTLRDVERITGGKINNAGLSQLETGKTKNPSIFVVIYLAAAYGLSEDEVLRRARDGYELPEPEFCPSCGQIIR